MANCSKCGKTTTEGQHDMSQGEAQRWPRMACPKCSKDAYPQCVAESIGHYRCSCGKSWTEPLASF